jgi:transcriptional regulator
MSGHIVDARLAEKVKALRDQGKTQEQIAADNELRIAQSTVSVIPRRGGLGGRLISARRLQR